MEAKRTWSIMDPEPGSTYTEYLEEIFVKRISKQERLRTFLCVPACLVGFPQGEDFNTSPSQTRSARANKNHRNGMWNSVMKTW